MSFGRRATATKIELIKIRRSMQVAKMVHKILDEVPLIVGINNDVPAKNLKELVDLAKAKPGHVTFASASTSQLVSTEMMNSMAGVKMGHVSYIGDADIGADVNIGAGTITANYDGQAKHRTVIGDRAFIGSDTILRAPVAIGPDAVTGAGSVVTRDVPSGKLAVGVPARIREKRVAQEPAE